MFTKDDFIKGTYSFSWDNRRWNRLLKQGWIVVWRKRNRTTQKYHIYKVSYKCKQLISRMYRIMLGEEDMPTTKLEKSNRYSYKVITKAIDYANKDKIVQYNQLTPQQLSAMGGIAQETSGFLDTTDPLAENYQANMMASSAAQGLAMGSSLGPISMVCRCCRWSYLWSGNS